MMPRPEAGLGPSSSSMHAVARAPGDGAAVSAAPAYGATRPVAGIALLVLSAWALSGLDASGKWVMGAGVSLVMLCWVRYVVHLLLVLGLLLPTRGVKVLRSVRPRAQLLRGSVMLLATFSFFNTLSLLPQAEATAINFLAPLIVLSLAPWLLKEPARISRWVAAGVGFLGVLIIIRPDGGLDPAGTVSGLVTAVLFACQNMATRRVAVDDPFTTVVWSGAVGAICLTVALPFVLPGALPFLSTLGPWHWLVLISTGFWGAAGHLLQIQAYYRAPASMLAPFIYLQIISAATLGWLVWGQFPDMLTWVGILVICVSGILLGVWEWHNRKRR